MEKKIQCHCGSELSFMVDEKYSALTDPGIKDDILSGSFLAQKCEVCKSVIKPEFHISFEYDKNHIIELIPEMDRAKFLLGEIKVQKNSMIGVGFRVRGRGGGGCAPRGRRAWRAGRKSGSTTR